MSVTRATDFLYAFRLLYLIQRDWKDQEAFKHGIIDDKGKVLRRWSQLRTGEERDSYTYFHRLAFNLKRMLQRVPGFNNRFMQVGAAMRLLREESELLQLNISEEELSFIEEKLMTEELVEDAPTNVTGDAVSVDGDEPLGMVRRKKKELDFEELKEAVDPMSLVILSLGAIAAFPIAKKVAEVVEPIVDYIASSSSKNSAKNADMQRRLRVAKDMVKRSSGEERRKLLDLVMGLESQLES